MVSSERVKFSDHNDSVFDLKVTISYYYVDKY